MIGQLPAARTVAAIRRQFDDAICVWVDVGLCPLTSHGHCAILDEYDGIDLDRTLEALAGCAVRSRRPAPAASVPAT
jgi:delta-aminolevulinic acid dehydratase/porphobilinogen synthase